jgi:hypothetical protein
MCSRGEFHVDANTRWSFALDYTFDLDTQTLSISGIKKPVPIITLDLNATEEVTASARIGDSDGANLPWFEHADAVLLYWWIDKTTISVPLTIIRSTDVEHGISTLDVQITDRTGDPLLSIQIPSNHTSSITASVPETPHSTSPSATYPLRVVIIHILAPTTLLVVGICELISITLKNLFKVAFYGFFIFGVVVAFWKCFGGPAVETTVGRMQERLERWKEIERLRFLPLDAVQRRLDRLYHRTTRDNREEREENGSGKEQDMV